MKELHLLIGTIGQAATLRLVEEFGGTRIICWKRMPKKHPLRRVIGDEAVDALIRDHAGIYINVPIARRWRFEIYNSDGMKPREMALKLGCSENTIYGYMRGERRAPGQLQLALEQTSANPR
jgi:hypothetical protein